MRKDGKIFSKTLLFLLLIILTLAGFAIANIGLTVNTPTVGNIAAADAPITVNVTITGSDVRNITNVTAFYAASGASTYAYACHNDSINLTEYICSWNPSLNGTFTLNVSIYNNTASIINSTSVSLFIDTIYPTIQLTSPSSTNTTNNNVTMKYTAVDYNLSVCQIYFGTTGNWNIVKTNASIFSSSFSENNTNSSLADGIYYFGVMCNDTLSNANWSTTNVTIGVDTTDPGFDSVYYNTADNLSSTNPSTGDLFWMNINWSDATLDADTAILYFGGTAVNTSAASADNTPTNLTYTIPDAFNGTYDVYMWVNDTVGNVNTTANVTITVSDNIAQAITPNSPVDGYNTSSTTVSLNFTVTDNVDTVLSCNVTIDGIVNISGVSVANGSSYKNSSLIFSETIHTWNVTCIDDDWNSNTSVTKTFTVDQTPLTSAPNITLVAAGVDGNINLSWVADGGAMKYGVFRSSSNSSNATSATRLANITGTSYIDNSTAHGSNYWYAVTSIDFAGNENLSVISNGSFFNDTASDTILPTLPISVTVTNSSNTATISWANVTTDILGFADIAGMNYTVWRLAGTTLNMSKNASANSMTRITTTTANSTTWPVPSDCSSSCNYLIAVTTIDDGSNENQTITAANLANITLSYTASSTTPSSSSSSSGTGGTLPSTSNNIASVSRQWASIDADNPIDWTISNLKIAVTKLLISVKNSYSNVGIDVKSMAKPETLPTPSQESYQYLQIDKSILPNSGIDEAKIQFKVPFSWFNANNIKRSSVKLLRYDVGWKVLDTKEIKADSTSATFEAITPGFSYFVIVGEKTVAETTPEETTATTPEETVPDNTQQQETTTDEPKEEKAGSLAWLWWTIAIIIIVGAIVVYLLAQGKPEKTTKETDTKKKEEKKK